MKRALGLIAAVVFAIAVADGRSPTNLLGQQSVDRQVALTFDDLPVTGDAVCDAGHVRRVTRMLTRALEAAGVPAVGLASPGRSCISPILLKEILGRWQDIGAVIGNHTATHPDLNTTPADVYLADLERAQVLIDQAVEVGERRWFRPPYLHSGDEPNKKNALVRHLEAHGYLVAPVTVDNQEWVYAAVYSDATARGDDELASRVAEGYLEHLEASMAFYESLSREVLGREIPQVLLLHANLLNANLMERVVAMLQRRGYRFVSLPDAVSDPAYAREDTYVGPRGLSWIQRWAIEDGVPVPDEPREAEWVAEEFRRLQQRSRDEAAVRVALEHYLAGHATGQGARFDSAFHSMANLYWAQEGEVRSRTAASYIAGASGRPADNEADRHRQITWVEITGDAAVARIDLDYPGVSFTDYMSLLRGSDGWQIVNKIYHADRTGPRTDPSVDAPQLIAGSEDDRPNMREAEAIAAASRAFSQAYMAGDTATIRELYTDDSMILAPERDVLGAEAAAQYFAPASTRRNLDHSMVSETLELTGDRAIDTGMWHNTWQVGEREPQSASGRYLVIWRRGVDGRWRIEYDMWHRPRG